MSDKKKAVKEMIRDRAMDSYDIAKGLNLNMRSTRYVLQGLMTEGEIRCKLDRKDLRKKMYFLKP